MQKQVYGSTAPGLPGMKAGLNPFVHHPGGLMAEGEVRVGNFVWPGSDPEIQATAEGKSGDQPVGLVERNLVYATYDPTGSGGLIVTDGETLCIGVRGDYWVYSGTPAQAGQKVFADLKDGGIVTGPENSSIEGAVETSWKVMTSGPANSPIIISNWSV